jgi:ABC-type multidrug transport system permease subunit
MITAASPRPLVSPAARDRKFYTSMGIVMLFTALVGFSRTYFIGLISGHPTTITGRIPNATVHLHALLFMSWLVLFIVQTRLIATHRVKVHRKLGYFGVVLAAAMIVVGGRTAVEAARLGAVPPGNNPWTFTAIPFGDIATFAIFFLGAVLWRNDRDKHKRLMILASACLMSAALVRWPGVLRVGPLSSYGLTLLFPIAAAVYDRWSRGRVHPVYWWGLALLVVGVAVRVVLLGSPAWGHAMQSLFG